MPWNYVPVSEFPYLTSDENVSGLQIFLRSEFKHHLTRLFAHRDFFLLFLTAIDLLGLCQSSAKTEGVSL